MQVAEQQMSIMLTLLQFIALAVPAVAMMMQVVLRFQDRYSEDENTSIGSEFRLIEGSFLALVIGGILISYPIVDSLSSGIAQVGISLALLALLLLVLATGLALRRPKYPKGSYDSVEEAVMKTSKKVGGTIFAFVLVGILSITAFQILELMVELLSFELSSGESLVRNVTAIVQVFPLFMMAMILLEIFAGIARLQD